MYVCYAHGGRTIIRGNLIHDTCCNRFRRGESFLDKSDVPCHGLYLDSGMSGGRYLNNVVFRNAGGPLLFNSHQNKNEWLDNLFLKDGTLPPEFLEAMQACAGLEPAYQKTGEEARNRISLTASICCPPVFTFSAMRCVSNEHSFASTAASVSRTKTLSPMPIQSHSE